MVLLLAAILIANWAPVLIASLPAILVVLILLLFKKR